MTRESTYRAKVVGLLRPVAAFPVENEVSVGQPDVCCILGWIEMKVGVTQKRESSRVAVKMRPSQRIWHRRWRQHGARSWVLTIVDDRVWYLHDGAWAAERLGDATEQEMRDAAIATWGGGPSSRDLIDALRRPMPTPTQGGTT